MTDEEDRQKAFNEYWNQVGKINARLFRFTELDLPSPKPYFGTDFDNIQHEFRMVDAMIDTYVHVISEHPEYQRKETDKIKIKACFKKLFKLAKGLRAFDKAISQNDHGVPLENEKTLSDGEKAEEVALKEDEFPKKTKIMPDFIKVYIHDAAEALDRYIGCAAAAAGINLVSPEIKDAGGGKKEVVEHEWHPRPPQSLIRQTNLKIACGTEEEIVR